MKEMEHLKCGPTELAASKVAARWLGSVNSLPPRACADLDERESLDWCGR